MIATREFARLNLDDALDLNIRSVRRIASRAWRVEEPPPVDEWIESSIVIPAESEGMPGPISFSDRPWWRELLKMAVHPDTRDIAVVAATQVGKTLTLDLALMLYFAEWMPAPAMLIVPDENEASMLRDRIYAIAKESARVGKFKRIRIPPQWKWNMKFIDLGAMRVYLAWSGSKQRTRGKPCSRVWNSEVDAYRKADKKTGDAVEAGRQRVKSRPRFLRAYESSPGESPSRICDIEAASGARYRWHGKCPHCGRLQEVRFFVEKHGDLAGRGGIVGYKNDESGELVSQDDARRNAHYICLSGCKIETAEKNQFLEEGEWVPLGCTIKMDGEIEGPLPTSTREIGAQLWSIHSPYISFGDVAAEYIRAQNEGTVKEFFGNWLAIAHASRTKVPHYQELARKMAWTHERGTVPHQCWFLTCGVDVQGENNGVRYVIRGWAPERTSWLINWGWLERSPGDENVDVKSDMLKMEREVLLNSFPVVGGTGINPCGKSIMTVRLTGVDSNHLPFKVHHWIRSLPESWRELEDGRVRAFRGDHKLTNETRYRHSVVESNSRTGEIYEGGMDQWGIFVYPFYDRMYESLASEPNKPGAFYLTSDVAQQGRSYLEQVCNFARKTEFSNKTGKKITVHKPKTDRIPVDFFDCEIYAMVAADMVVGDLGWKEETWKEAWGNDALSAEQQDASSRNVRRADAEQYGER